MTSPPMLYVFRHNFSLQTEMDEEKKISFQIKPFGSPAAMIGMAILLSSH